jgi:MerR family transcriptional regulator, light-induced transcriptional regulator
MISFAPKNYQILGQHIVDSHYQINPALEERYGETGKQKCIDDAVIHLTYLQQAIDNDSAELFEDYIRWAKTLFEGINLPLSHLKEHLEVLQVTLSKLVEPKIAQKASQIIAMAALVLDDVDTEQHSFLDDQAPLHELTKSYLAALLASNRSKASQLINSAIEQDGISLQDIYLHVFQTAQREVGLLWQTGKISVAQEHFCTAATQLCMSQLYRYIFQTKKNGLKAVICCAEGELHEIGVRMVADLLEMNGWDAHYLGANTPRDSVMEYLEKQRPSLIGISATITSHLPDVVELIKKIRAQNGHSVKIIVGGYPFNVDNQLWKQIGADASAANASSAIEQATQLLVGNG